MVADDMTVGEKVVPAAQGEDGDQVPNSEHQASCKNTGNHGNNTNGTVEVASCRVREATERIKGMRRWRKELEWSVYWHREEYWRVENAMGRKRSESVGRSEDESVGKWVGARYALVFFVFSLSLFEPRDDDSKSDVFG